MTRSSLPIAVAAAVSAGLLLTACGGGGSDSSDKIQPDTTGPSASASSPTASASASSAVRRPSTALPKGFTVTFDWPKTGDATKDAILQDGEQYIRAYNRAAALGTLKDPAYGFYSRNQGLSYAQAQIKANIDGGWAPTGVDHYYRVKADVIRTGAATLSYCEDQSKAYSKNVKTGKVNITTASANSFVLYNVLFVKDAASNGVWQASQVTVIERATQCAE